MLRLADGENAKVEKLWVEALDEKVPVYNFEVADYHTYYVSELGVLVHNMCAVMKKSGTTRVGRWMSKEEYYKMVKTGYVQKPFKADQSYVANPADYNAFYKQAKKGTIYVEFDVPSESLKQTKDMWATIPGPNSVYSKLNIKKGLPAYEFPKATNIKVVGGKK